jgi:hypothetical protein
MELWKKIPNFEYKISNFGRVRNQAGKILKPYLSKGGYHQVRLYGEGSTKKAFYVHNLVATAFLDPPEEENMKPKHKNAIKTDNRAENLHYWRPSKRRASGEESGRSVLNVEDVLEIKRLLRAGEKTHKEISEIFNVAESTVTKINTGKTWRKAWRKI